MKIKGYNRCIACMRLLGEDGTCSYCHFQQEDYRPIPRCLRPGVELAGRYVLGRVLGEGSFGITYIAWDSLLDTTVAIKEYFPSNLASRHVGEGKDFNVYIYEKTDTKNYQDKLQKYLDEAKSLSAFSELDGIVSVRDFFYENQTAYIVMAYVEGVSVKEYVERNGRIEGELFLEMLKPILYSLAKVHETGVLHRDISPDNILITKENKMVLIDFGAARKENISMTRSMTVVFKQGYSPEEQYRTHGKQGAWSDIYALCATAYYALTGKRPDEAIERVLEDEMQSLEEMPDVQLTDFQKKCFMKGIAVRPTERYQTVQEFYHDLYIHQEEKKPWKFYRYQREIKIAVSLLLMLSIFGIWQWRTGGSLRRQAKTAETISGQMKRDTNMASSSGASGEAVKQSGGNSVLAGVSDESNASRGSAGVNDGSIGVDGESAGNKQDATTALLSTREVASYKGLKRAEAEQKLVSEGDPGLEIVWKESYSDTVKKGVIIGQSIDAGTKYKPGEYMQLTLTVSKGVKKVKVPSVEGMSRESAIKKLENKRLKVTEKHVQSSRVSQGNVMEQSIAGGRKVKKGTKVTITVSSGIPESKTTPKPPVQTPRSNRSKKKQPEEEFAGVIP